MLDLSERLHHVAVQQNIAGAADLRDFANRLDHAGFIIRSHDRNKGRVVWRMALGELIEIDEPSRETFNHVTSKPSSFLQMLDRVQHRVMLRLGS